MQSWFLNLCPGRSEQAVACTTHYVILTGMFLELRFPLPRIKRALRTALIIFIIVKWERTSCHPPFLCPTMPPLARQLPPEPTTISRSHTVSRRAPKLAANKTFTFWRRVQSQKRKRVLTVGDRLVQTKKRKQHRREYQDVLEEAHATIRELAEGLRNRFGKYSVDHYYSDLIH